MKFTGKVKLNVKGIKNLKTELALVQKSEVRVGVFAEKANRDDDSELNNAEIGAVHELGSKKKNIPIRSFLRVPCFEDLPKALKAKGQKQLVSVIIKTGTKDALENLGVMAEQVVDEAFETRGKGRWAPLKAETIRRKGSDVPLFDSGKLSAAVSSKVMMGGKDK